MHCVLFVSFSDIINGAHSPSRGLRHGHLLSLYRLFCVTEIYLVCSVKQCKEGICVE